MMHVLSCEHVREQLHAYHDGELSLDDQVRIQAHLRDCVACAIESADIEALGEGIRAIAASLPDRAAVESARLPAAVLERLRVEQQFSFTARARALFDDMHFIWAALGATCAMILCLFASMGVLQAASRERPDSLAGIINQLSNTGSDAYPMVLAGWMRLPRALFETPMPASDEDAVLTLSAVVTREGRVERLAVVGENGETVKVKPEVLLAMMNAAASARFQPAQSNGAPVAVNVVWLLASTTVKGQADYDRYLVNPPRWADPTTVAPARRTAPPAPPTPIAASTSGDAYAA